MTDTTSRQTGRRRKQQTEASKKHAEETKAKLASEREAREKASKEAREGGERRRSQRRRKKRTISPRPASTLREHEDDGSGPDPNSPQAKDASKSEAGEAEGRIRDASSTRVMTVRGFLTRVANSLIAKGEGDYRPGPYYLPITGGWLPAGVGDNWWQQGYTPANLGASSSMVEACVSAYAQTVAMCPGDHWRLNGKDGRDRIKNSALARILRHPNDYQSISDFLLNATRWLYLNGNAYALALRNYALRDRRASFNGSRICRSRASRRTARSFTSFTVTILSIGGLTAKSSRRSPCATFSISGFIRLTGAFPFRSIGESPIVAAYSDIDVGCAIAGQQVAFYRNEARPSAVLSHRSHAR